jgi:hypothetical protein
MSAPFSFHVLGFGVSATGDENRGDRRVRSRSQNQPARVPFGTADSGTASTGVTPSSYPSTNVRFSAHFVSFQIAERFEFGVDEVTDWASGRTFGLTRALELRSSE